MGVQTATQIPLRSLDGCTANADQLLGFTFDSNFSADELALFRHALCLLAEHIDIVEDFFEVSGTSHSGDCVIELLLGQRFLLWGQETVSFALRGDRPGTCPESANACTFWGSTEINIDDHFLAAFANRYTSGSTLSPGVIAAGFAGLIAHELTHSCLIVGETFGNLLAIYWRYRMYCRLVGLPVSTSGHSSGSSWEELLRNYLCISTQAEIFEAGLCNGAVNWSVAAYTYGSTGAGTDLKMGPRYTATSIGDEFDSLSCVCRGEGSLACERL